MSFILTCPVCGPRPVDEYSYGGEITSRPASSEDERKLFSYLYFRRNVAGVQREWWFHTSGCREWLQADRDTRNNRVLRTAPPGGLTDDDDQTQPAKLPTTTTEVASG
jgi:sarcosine oxidase subunit delta